MFSCGKDEKPKEKTLVSIAVTTPPTKTIYEVNDTFDPAGMVVTAEYSDNTSAPVTLDELDFEFDFGQAGMNITVTIKFTYNGIAKLADVTGITVTATPVKTVSVGAQSGALIAGTEGMVTFAVTTTNIANNVYPPTVANLPTGVIVQGGSIEISTNAGTLTLAGNTSTKAGATSTLTLTIDGATSTPFTFTISSASDGTFCGGTGDSDDPYLICTAAQLAKLAEMVNAFATNSEYGDKYYKLLADIDLSDNGTEWNDGKGWIPIGSTYGNSFKGNFDGNNHKVSGLYINDNNLGYAGLFGYIVGGAVQNLGVEGSVTGKFHVGGVVGIVWEGSVTNCYVTGTVSGNNFVGGVAGEVGYCSVTNCYSAVAVSGIESFVGGVAGDVDYSSIVANCNSTGTVSGESWVGGVVGWLSDSSSVTDCYATGTVSGNSGIGGVVARVNGLGSNSVTKCYATGAITGTSEVGGVAGYVSSGSSVTDCVALNPSITRSSGSSTTFGRVAGNKYGTLSNNVAWANMELPSGTYGENGANITVVQAKTQTTYTGLGWAFGTNEDNPWKMGIGGYGLPVFYWQTAAPAAMPEHLK